MKKMMNLSAVIGGIILLGGSSAVMAAGTTNNMTMPMTINSKAMNTNQMMPLLMNGKKMKMHGQMMQVQMVNGNMMMLVNGKMAPVMMKCSMKPMKKMQNQMAIDCKMIPSSGS